MSLLSHITGAVTGAVKGFARGGVTGAVAGGITGGIKGKGGTGNMRKGSPVLGTTSQYSASPTVRLAALPGVQTAISLARRAAPVASKVLPGVGTAIAVAGAGSMLYDEVTGMFHHTRRRRRMNPLNVRAARRAIRRIKAVRKITNEIERSLPKARSTARSRGGYRSAPRFIENIRNS